MAVEITWLGRNCFRIKGRDGVVLTDPCPPESGYKLAKQSADVATISRKDDPGYSYRDVLGSDTLVLDAPGEYETGGILVTGVARKRPDGARNVMFVYELDGIRIGHLGLPAAPGGLDDLKDVDILLIPAGGGNSLHAAAAADVMTTIDPKIAIPMNYRTDVETMQLDTLDLFLKETGSKPEAQPRLQLTRSQLPSNLTIVVLEPK